MSAKRRVLPEASSRKAVGRGAGAVGSADGRLMAERGSPGAVLTYAGRLILRLTVASGVLASQAFGATQTRQPFALLEGSWSGHGTISVLAGVEHATCDAVYQVGGNAAKLSLKCATESFRLNLASSVVDNGGTISGTWAEYGFGTSGSVSGRVDGDRIGLAASVVGARVLIVIATHNGRQTVSLRTSSPFVTGGDLVLTRGG